MSDADHAVIAGLGRTLGPAVLADVHALYRERQDRLAAGQPAAATDRAYGPDPRQRLDLYAPTPGRRAAPVLLWVHGGGFLRGGKGGPGDPWNAHVGRWAARSGLLGAVMTYRLAPDHVWPAGSDDVGLAIDWLRDHVADHGGDPERIVVMGTSAGATHVAGHLRDRAMPPGVRAAVLLSGLYGFTPLDARDTLYFGPQETYPDRCAREAIVATALPLLVACSAFDPPRFQAEFSGLLSARLDRHGGLPAAHVGAGHNHFSLAYHIGTDDRRLSDDVLAFCDATTR